MPTGAIVSIVIPVYKGARTIGRLVDACIQEVGQRFNLEIILVNDHSPDDSREVCIALYEQYPDIVRFFSLAKTVGEHNAVMAGLNQTRGEYVVIMDDDFQNPPSDACKLVDAIAQGEYDVVYSRYEQMNQSMFRRAGSWFNDRVANIMLGKPNDLYLSSFKCLNRFLVDEIIKYELPYPYVDGLVLRTTDNIGLVTVVHNAQVDGQSRYTVRKLLSLWLNMFVNFSIAPLRLAALIGMIAALFGLGLGVESAVERMLRPDVPIGWTTVIVAVSLFAGVQLLALGAIGEYLGRMFLSQNRKPQYTIRSRFERSGGDSHGRS